jgi:hypothetical protein
MGDGSKLAVVAFLFFLLLLLLCFKHKPKKREKNDAHYCPLFLFKQKKNIEKKIIEKETKMQRREITCLKPVASMFGCCFYVWDEVFLFPSPLDGLSMLSCPPSSSLVSHVSSKL